MSNLLRKRTWVARPIDVGTSTFSRTGVVLRPGDSFLLIEYSERSVFSYWWKDANEIIIDRLQRKRICQSSYTSSSV